MPSANSKAEEIWNRINDRPARSYSYLNRHWVLGRDKNRIYHYDFFDPGRSAFSRLSIFDLDRRVMVAGRPEFAEKAFLSGDRLRLRTAGCDLLRPDLPESFAESPSDGARGSRRRAIS